MTKKVDIYAVYNDLPIIFWRIDQQNYPAVDALLKAGADIETRGIFGMTPVIWAASGGSWGMVKFLIDRGANLTAYAEDGMTVANLALNSRVLLDSPNGQDLQDVRAILAERGLYDNIPTRAELREQMEAGTLSRPPYFDAWRATHWPADANARADKIRAQQ
ncbi:ankyrin repeat domain-containing protein [Paracoccus tegillarcae]|nr:ankyrin repeat domain-containing protein [Paracoccus tegillarcae]